METRAAPVHVGHAGPRQCTLGTRGVGLGASQWIATYLDPLEWTEPRGVVGFEGILGALLAALDGSVFSIHGGGEQRHGLLG